MTGNIAGNIIRNVGLRLVLDTSVIVAALRSRYGASQQLLLAAANGDFQLLLSVPLVLEYEAVLSRPEQRLYCGLSLEAVQQVLDNIVSIAEEVTIDIRWRPQLSDPDDDMVLEAAVNGNADAIVTFNRNDFIGTGLKFGCPAITPAEALGRIRSSRS